MCIKSHQTVNEPFKDAIDKLHKESYHIMQVMNGINPGDPTYNTDQNIDNYKSTM